MSDYNKIYDILVDECGASAHPEEKYNFVWSLSNYDSNEYRFQGKLGFGGKLHYWHSKNKYTVQCYKEDETPERLEIIRKANERLQKEIQSNND